MSKRSKLHAVPVEKPENGKDDFLIEEGIDAIDQLSTKMRQAGMIDCANALDEVFVRCLRNYVARIEGPEAANRKVRKRGDGNSD